MTIHSHIRWSGRWARIAVFGVVVCTFGLGLLSCPLPIDELMVEQLKDDVTPSVVIDSPSDESYYAATVVVTGSATDATGGASGEGQIKSLSYETIPAMTPGGEIDVAEDGSFSFSFATTGFTGSMIVRLTAEDWNGQVSSTSITLRYGGNGIPSLSAVPDNKKITLTWDPVPMSTGYTLLYTTNGAIPSDSYGYRIDGVESGLEMPDLDNGAMHVFILQSHSSSGDDNWSDVVRAIPLSPATLAPTVVGNYGVVNVTWPNIPATDSFEVWRAVDRAGPYNLIASDAGADGFTDTFVQPGDYYYYQVRPALVDSIMSGVGAGTPGVLYPYGITQIGLNAVADDGHGVAARSRLQGDAQSQARVG